MSGGECLNARNTDRNGIDRTAAQPQKHFRIVNIRTKSTDRILMEADPFAVIEAMTIAALATGCTQGYLSISAGSTLRPSTG